jgi:hypothetical protein
VFEELEKKLLDPEFRRHRAKVSALLDEEFVEFGASGRRFNREEILALLEEESVSEITASEFETTMLSNRAALVTYRSMRRNGKISEARRSSVWVDRGNGWKLVFHHGTKIEEEASRSAWTHTGETARGN